ncbi:MAG: hypothetical protein LBT80_02615 [Lactobacillaceae bacterium]|jgi:hypothetical protein|nr:hypothetical protein [Lactobacillaceae bacterium]
MRKKNNLKLIIDLFLTAIVVGAGVFLWINGDHIPPRQARYMAQVQTVNTDIDNTMLRSLSWLANRAVVHMQYDDDPQQIVDKYTGDYKSNLAIIQKDDPQAMTVINNQLARFTQFTKINKYTKKELRAFGVKMPYQDPTEKIRFQDGIRQLKIKIAQEAKQKHAELLEKKASDDKAEAERQASLAESQAVAASIAAEEAAKASAASSSRANTEPSGSGSTSSSDSSDIPVAPVTPDQPSSSSTSSSSSESSSSASSSSSSEDDAAVQ